MKDQPSGRTRHGLGQWILFLPIAVALSVALFGLPLFDGRAYSQADVLFQEYPWAAHRPAGYHGPQNSLLADAAMLFYPNASFTQDRMKHWELPLWNPYAYGGQPFLGAAQTALFSPITAILYVVPLPDALTWMYLARVLLGGVGMFVLLGSLGVAGWSRGFGALGWLLAPFTIVWLAHPLSEVAAWLPWLVYCTRNVCRRGRIRSVSTLAVVTACALFAGHPETTMKALVLCGLLAPAFVFDDAGTPSTRANVARDEVAGAPTRKKPRVRGALGRLGLAGAGVALGLALAGIQILPTLEYLRASTTLAGRKAGAANIYVMAPETAVTAVVPNFLGHPASNTYLPMENRYGLSSNYAEQQTYPGMVVWMLAAVGTWSRRRDLLTWALVGAGVLSALLMYGTPGITGVVTRLPIFDVLVLSRFGMVVIFCAVWLATRGLEALIKAPRDTAAFPAPIAALAMAGLVGASLVFFRHVLISSGRLLATLGWSAWAAALGGTVLILVTARKRERVSAFQAGAGATVLLSIDLAVFAWGFHPTINRSEVFPVVPEIQRVQADTGLLRVIGWNQALLPNAATAYKLSDVRGYDGIGPLAWGELLETALYRGQFHELRDESGLRLLDLLNVRYVFADPGVSLPASRFSKIAAGPAPLWQNKQAFPRAFLADRFSVVRTPEELRSALRDPSIDLRRTALLEESPARDGTEDFGGWSGAAIGTARVRQYRDTLVEVDTDAPDDRLLVLSDNNFPGWNVAVDGERSRLLTAYGALRAVRVPGGRHVVQFTYRPASVLVGAGISLLAACVTVACFFHGDRRKRLPIQPETTWRTTDGGNR